jgi:hypothetical protein
MLEFNVSQSARLPVVLKNSSNAPATGVLSTQAILSIIWADGTSATFNPVTASAWMEVTATAYSGSGYYQYVLTSTLTYPTGVFQYCISSSLSVPYFGVVKMVDGGSGEIYDRIGMPVCGTIANDIQNIPTSVASGGFGAADRAALYATYTATLPIPSDPTSVSGVNAMFTAAFPQINTLSNILAIKAKTDNLPTDPASTTTINAQLTSTITTLEADLSGQLQVMKGGAWTNDQTIYNIGVHTSATWYSATFVPWLNESAADAYFSKTWGIGFTTGVDDLVSIALAIQGITPGSGGGGFSSADRAALYSAYSQTLPLPPDPASTSGTSGSIFTATLRIVGLYPYGAASATSPDFTLYNEFQIWSTASEIKTHTDYIQLTSMVATQIDVTGARDYLAGAGYVSASNSLVAITNLITGSTFGTADRAVLAGISASVGFGLTGTANTILSDVVAIKAKTDLLPNDVVSSASVFPVLYLILSQSSVSGGFSTSDRNNIIYISQTLGLPTTTPTIAGDLENIIGTQGTQGGLITNIYVKTNNLPVDPVSTTYVGQVSSSLTSLITGSISASVMQITSSISGIIAGGNTGLSGVMHAVQNELSGNISATFWALSGTLGVPVYGSLALDIANVQSTAQTAATYAQDAYVAIGNVELLLGTPFSGTVSADISATYHAVQAISATFTGSISATVDFTPILKVLGTPVKTVSDDVYRIGAMSQQIGAMVGKIPQKK